MDQASLRNKYNPDYFKYKTEQLLETVTNSEAEGWYVHPCTQAMIAKLEEGMSEVVLDWMSGSYTKESIEAASQLNAKALGCVQTLELMLMFIKDIRRSDVGDNT